MGWKPVIVLILFVSMPYFSMAAIIHGTVYDLALEQQTNVLVTVNSMPAQFMVSKDGAYQFDLPKGNFTIKAHGTLGLSEDNVSIVDDNDYVLDIVLSPEIGIPPDNYFNDSLGIDLSLVSENDTIKNASPVIQGNESSLIPSLVIYVIAGIIVFFAIAFFIIGNSKGPKDTGSEEFHKQESKSELEVSKLNIEHDNAIGTSEVLSNYEKNYLTDVLDIIRKEKHVTQKEIRKQIPLSEAKISLIIADLENQGKIRKIKQGRGNILAYIKG